MATHRAEALVLALAGTAREPDPGIFPRSDDRVWDKADALTCLHRLQPWFYARHGANPGIPQRLKSGWQAAYRQSAMTWLAQQADLRDCVALLRNQGFEAVALKGAYLGAYSYPEAAQRPMRDIDLLVPRQQVAEAYRALLREGWEMLEEPRLALEDIARVDAHMPPLRLPRGTILELHGQLLPAQGRLEYPTPQGFESALIDRAIVTDGIRYPAAQDMFAHLVLHAVYGHRFDCGPLALADIHYLVQKQPIDWDDLWDRARTEGWEKGARLMVELVRLFHGDAGMGARGDGPSSPDHELVLLSRELLLQDYTAKKPARLLATIATGGWGQVTRLAKGQISPPDSAPIAIDRGSQGGWFRWIIGQSAEFARALLSPATWRQARQLARFSLWLKKSG